MRQGTHADGWMAALRSFVQPAQRVTRCEVCGDELPQRHAHMFDPRARRVECACGSCALLDGSPDGLRSIPERSAKLHQFHMSETQWLSMGAPAGVAFLVKSSLEDHVVAISPGAAGAIESVLDGAAWRDLESHNPALRELAPDVEALVVSHAEGERHYYRMPIDRCYALAQVVRSHWRGATGGDGMHAAVSRFLNDTVEGRPADARRVRASCESTACAPGAWHEP